MGKTSIQWTDHSVNPLRSWHGHFCQKISPGCANCYASKLQSRFGNLTYSGASGEVPPIREDRHGLWLDDGKLQQVLGRKMPTRYFWCDMTDLFGPWVPDEWIDKCFAAMALTPHHTHQVLTKRPERMREYFSERYQPAHYPPVEHDGPEECTEDREDRVKQAASNLLADSHIGNGKRFWTADGAGVHWSQSWPLPNVWLGVSVENQAYAENRIPHLIQTPAAVRFLSCEPLLGPIELQKVTSRFCPQCRGAKEVVNSEDGGYLMGCPCERLAGLSWVIVGGESGHNARPFDVAWGRSLIEQCKEAGVPVFMKQLGGNIHTDAQDCGWGQAMLPIHVLPDGRADDKFPLAYRVKLSDPKGGDMDEWPEDLRVREFPLSRSSV